MSPAGSDVCRALTCCLVLAALVFGCGPSTTDGDSAVLPEDSQDAAPEKHVNIVWILLDACRADHMSSYGYTRETTPNIDAIGRQGVVFLRHFAQAPYTLQSVPIYFTGRYNAVPYQDVGKLGIYFLRKPLPGEQLLSTTLKKNGYATAMFSASPWYSAKSRLGRSFETFGELEHGAEAQGSSYADRNPELFRWIEDHAESPFFLYVHSMDVHGPRYENNTLDTWLHDSFPKKRDAQLRKWVHGQYTPEERSRLTDLYDGGLGYADSAVGEIFTHLGDLGLEKNTIVIIGSDHGELLGADGERVGHPSDASHDDLLHIPLIVAGPGIPESRRVDAFTENTDIVPTLVDLLGVHTDAVYHGHSLRRLMSGSVHTVREFVYARSMSFTPIDEPNRIFLFDNVKFDIAPETSPQARSELAPHFDRTERILVYKRPDRQGARELVQAPPARLASVENQLAKSFLPLWEAQAGQDVEIPPSFKVAHFPYAQEDRVAQRSDPRDGKWAWIEQRSPLSLGIDYLLIAQPWAEDVEPITLSAPVPNGTYRVKVHSTTLKDSGRGVSFSFATPDMAAGKRFELAPAEPGAVNEKLFDLGVHEVTDDTFRYTIDVAAPGADCVVGSLWFFVAGSDADAPEVDDVQTERDRLEALGYL